MKIKNKGLSSLIALLAFPVLGAFAQVPAGFNIELVSTFDYPGAGNSTQPQKVNDGGDIVGTYFDSSAIYRGFVRFKNGGFSPPLVAPHDTGGGTQARGINNSRLLCGVYLDAGSGTFTGFFLSGSRFQDYLVPGSTFTSILGLNNFGDFCGTVIPASGVLSGFVSIGGAITEFVVPRSINTLAYQINASNQTCGYYTDRGGITHGFYRDGDGSLLGPIDPAGSTGTTVFGNNDSNFIVGRYLTADGKTHGFLFVPPNNYVSYDFPGSDFTSLNGINRRGQIVGRYDDASGLGHGIILQVVRSASDQATGGVTPQRQGPETASERGALVEPAL